MLAGFAAALAGLLVALGQEWRWGRARTRGVAALGPPVRVSRACAAAPDEQS